MLRSGFFHLVARRVLTAPSLAHVQWKSFSVTIPATVHISINDTGEGREYTHPKIGDREIVGWGRNGQENYFDIPDFPYPAIRFKPPNAPGVKELREKEKGDWKKLTLEEKKGLYRASFCQTYAEFMRGTEVGEWKVWLGVTFVGLTFTLWIWIWLKYYVYNRIFVLPDTFKEEYKQHNLWKSIAMRKDPVLGLASRWDYENDRWL